VTDTSTLRTLLAEVEQAHGCAHPIRLVGAVVDGDHPTSRTVTVACKDRRVAVCPACAYTYKGDAWQVVATGLRGGKGVPADVAERPRLFVTLTAPGFGTVHRQLASGAPCRARRGDPRCHHGMADWCPARHGDDDPRLGEPLCPACFDYEGAVLWNAHASMLWQRTTTAVRRALADRHGLSEAALRRQAVVSYTKVAEFQRRGLVHFHVVVRADGPDGPDSPPPAWLDAALLAEALRRAAGATTVGSTAGGRSGWGAQVDVRDLADADGPGARAVAAYVAKYAVKTAEDSGALARPVRSPEVIPRLGLRPHVAQLVRTAWALSGDPAHVELRLRAHAHTFGYPGHLLTKSRRYSTTFGALRRARADQAAAASGIETAGGSWVFLRRGYRQPGAADLATALALAARGLPTSPPGSPVGSPDVPHLADQG